MTGTPQLRVLPQFPDNSRVQLFCLPYAGGGSRSYQSWSGLLPATVDVLTARLPGREARMDEPLPGSLRALAAETAREVGTLFTGRLAVFGHSMGALLAFEFVRELRRVAGREPDCLVVSGMPAPDLLAGSMRYAQLSDAELLAEVTAMGTSAPATALELELWELLLPALRSELRLCDEYEYRPAEPLTCPIVTYGSHGDRDLNEELLDGWRLHTRGSFDLRMFPGDHFYFERWPEAFAVDLVTRLRQYVENAPSAGAGELNDPR